MLDICDKLTEDQWKKFCEIYNCNLSELTRIDEENRYYLRMFTGYYGPQPEFYVTDTSFKGTNYFEAYDLTGKWLEYLAKIKNETKQNET